MNSAKYDPYGWNFATYGSSLKARFCALKARRNAMWEDRTQVQFSTANIVTKLTRYWKPLLEDVVAFMYARHMHVDVAATAHTGLPFFAVLANIAGAWPSRAKPYNVLDAQYISCS